jgi:hypothetical protein
LQRSERKPRNTGMVMPGTPATLLEAGGMCSRLCERQFNRSISSASLQPSG